jgi:hypothetical protein
MRQEMLHHLPRLGLGLRRIAHHQPMPVPAQRRDRLPIQRRDTARRSGPGSALPGESASRLVTTTGVERFVQELLQVVHEVARSVSSWISSKPSTSSRTCPF